VAVIGGSDEHTMYVVRALERRGAQVLFFDTAGGVPHQYLDGVVSSAGTRLEDVRSVYLKGVAQALPIPDPDGFPATRYTAWKHQYLAERERQSLVGSLVRCLRRPGVTFVNPPEASDLHFLKLYQLELLRRRGFDVPSTLATFDPQAVRDFAAHHRSIVYKPLAGGATVRRVSADDLSAERLEVLREAPVLFQEEVRGDEFRAYVLGGEPVAAFQVPTAGVVDARENLHRVRRARLSPSVWDVCVRAAEALGLVFTAVDLRRTRSGRVVLLELNPTPAIAFFDDPVRGAVMTRLVEFLLARA
jgi:glutathione synthase/RimK-type ligase-like ATP-grasp enzyme